MADELNEVKIILEKIHGEIALSEEKLSNKVERTEHLQSTQKIKDYCTTAINKLDTRLSAKMDTTNDRVTKLYIKVAVLSITSGGGAALLVKLFMS